MRSRGRPPTMTGVRRYPNRLRELRDSCGLSQRGVAAVAGISDAYYGALERGDKRINADIAMRLAAPLRCQPGELLGGGEAVSVPLVAAVAAGDSAARPPDYDLPEPHERVLVRRLAEPRKCFAAEIVDDSADVDFTAGTILVVRHLEPLSAMVPVGARVVVRFLLDPHGPEGNRQTHEIVYGILDCTVVGDLVLITRTRNRRIPRHLLIQSSSRPGSAEWASAPRPQIETATYEPRADDPGMLLGVVVYVMGPV
jgi:transcriptional regulator with XRE-family HTH domain